MESPAIKECIICCNDEEQYLYKICSCKRSFVCQMCKSTLEVSNNSKCPVCRKDLKMTKYLDKSIYKTILKSLWFIGLYILCNCIILFVYFI